MAKRAGGKRVGVVLRVRGLDRKEVRSKVEGLGEHGRSEKGDVGLGNALFAQLGQMFDLGNPLRIAFVGRELGDLLSHDRFRVRLIEPHRVPRNLWTGRGDRQDCISRRGKVSQWC